MELQLRKPAVRIQFVFLRQTAAGRRKIAEAEQEHKGKGKGFPYSTPSVGPGADPGVQAVSPQVTLSHLPGGGLPLLFPCRPAVTSPASEHITALWPVPRYTAW